MKLITRYSWLPSRTDYRRGKFLFSLYKNDPKTMLDVLYKATKYMNAENALLA